MRQQIGIRVGEGTGQGERRDQSGLTRSCCDSWEVERERERESRAATHKSVQAGPALAMHGCLGSVCLPGCQVPAGPCLPDPCAAAARCVEGVEPRRGAGRGPVGHASGDKAERTEGGAKRKRKEAEGKTKPIRLGRWVECPGGTWVCVGPSVRSVRVESELGLSLGGRTERAASLDSELRRGAARRQGGEERSRGKLTQSWKEGGDVATTSLPGEDRSGGRNAS